MSQRPNDLDPRAPTAAESLLRSARSDHAPSRADRERVRSALASKLAQGGAASGAAGDGPLSRAFSVLRALGTGVKATIGFGLLAAVAFTSLRVSEHANPATESTAASARPAAPSDVAPPPASTPSPTPEVEPSAPPAPIVRRQLERATADAAKVKARARSSRRAPEPNLEQSESMLPAPVASEASHTVDRSAELGEGALSAAAASGEDAQATAAVSGDKHPSTRHNNSAPRATPAASSTRDRAPNKPSAASTAEDGSDARAELAFVRRIQAALVEAKPERVLALCDTHARRWPHGTFEQEREGLRAIAACQSVLASGPALARSFIAKYPQSPMLPRMREACPPSH